MRFRKKPVVIEAVQIRATDFNGRTFDGNPFSEVAPQWLQDAIKEQRVFAYGADRDYALFKIMTLEGVMSAEPGDWIVRGIEGELYPVKPSIFAATYEPAE